MEAFASANRALLALVRSLKSLTWNVVPAAVVCWRVGVNRGSPYARATRPPSTSPRSHERSSRSLRRAGAPPVGSSSCAWPPSTAASGAALRPDRAASQTPTPDVSTPPQVACTPLRYHQPRTPPVKRSESPHFRSSTLNPLTHPRCSTRRQRIRPRERSAPVAAKRHSPPWGGARRRVAPACKPPAGQ